MSNRTVYKVVRKDYTDERNRSVVMDYEYPEVFHSQRSAEYYAAQMRKNEGTDHWMTVMHAVHPDKVKLFRRYSVIEYSQVAIEFLDFGADDV